MKKNLSFIIISIICLFLITNSCTVINCPNHPKWLCSKRIACIRHPPSPEPFKESPKGMAYINGGSYEYTDFPGEDSPSWGELSYREKFEEGGERYGEIIDGLKQGKWLSGDAGFDENGNVYAKGRIWREEYFKNGLRDSIYRRFDGDGKIIYETTFKKGTGLWKEFHSNGTLYFEIYTKDGYFTDTLKLYNDAGKIVARRLYVKDSLIYDEGLPCFPYSPDNVPSD